MKTRETWSVVGVITPDDLKDDPDKHGGPGLHMSVSVELDIHTVEIVRGDWNWAIPVSREDSDRICKDGAVDIAGSSNSIYNVEVYFQGTDEMVNLVRGAL